MCVRVQCSAVVLHLIWTDKLLVVGNWSGHGVSVCECFRREPAGSMTDLSLLQCFEAL